LRFNLKASADKYLYSAAGISTVVIITAVLTLLIKYIIPVYSGEITFIHDFSFYKTAAERFLLDPYSLYLTDNPLELSFIYPPPAVLLFTFFAGTNLPTAFTLFIIISAAFLIAAVYIFIRTVELIIEKPLDRRTKFLIYLIAIGNAPVYMNFQSSQVGTVLIFLISLFIYFIVKRKYIPAALALAGGVLFKLYPVFLFFAGFRKDGIRFLIFFIGSVATVTALSLFLVPLEVYEDYFFNIIPQISSNIELNTYNQSLSAVVLRLTDLYTGGWGMAEIPAALQYTNNIFFLLVLGFLGYKIFKSVSVKEIILNTIVISAIIPVFTVFGWGHLYILTIPLLVFTLFHHRSSLAFISLLMFAIEIPESLVYAVNIPELHHLFYARFLIGTILLLSIFFINGRTFRSVP
jgi:hypothetical protein